jgi:hypothetical protein
LTDNPNRLLLASLWALQHLLVRIDRLLVAMLKEVNCCGLWLFYFFFSHGWLIGPCLV